MNNTLRQTSAAIVYALLSTLASSIAHAEPTASVVFADGATREGERVDPGNIKHSFGCGEEIFGIVAVQGLSTGSHNLEARWLSPDGETVKSDAGTIEVPNAQQIAYLATSIAVQRNGDGVDEQSPFKGEWSVEVTVDGQAVGGGSVNVDC